MTKTYEDGLTIVFEENEKRVVITRNEYNNSRTPHYNVFIKNGSEKGKTVATRCTLEKALSFAK